MKKILLLLLIMAVCVGTGFSNGSKEEGKDGENAYVFAIDASWPPMEHINTDSGDIVGFTIDMMKAIAEEEGLEIEFENVGWDGIFAGLESGKYDAISSSVTITEERKQRMLFSDPYFNAGQILAVRTEDAKKYQSLDDLAGEDVAAQVGTTGASEIEKYPEVILKTYDDLAIGIEELATGTIEGVVADTPLIAGFLLEDRYKGKLVAVGNQMTNEYYGVAIRKDHEELRQKINSGLEKIKANGTYDEIYSKWIKNK